MRARDSASHGDARQIVELICTLMWLCLPLGFAHFSISDPTLFSAAFRFEWIAFHSSIIIPSGWRHTRAGALPPSTRPTNQHHHSVQLKNHFFGLLLRRKWGSAMMKQATHNCALIVETKRKKVLHYCLVHRTPHVTRAARKKATSSKQQHKPEGRWIRSLDANSPSDRAISDEFPTQLISSS